MEDGVANSEQKPEDMGVLNNPNSARLAVLKERKQQVEDDLAKRNQELRELCIQEAELTGITPQEMPLEAGETTLPHIPRRIVTGYQLHESLSKSANKDISDLEMQIQVHQKLAEAALGLCEQGSSKTIKRQHQQEYKKHQAEVLALKEQLTTLIEKIASEQVKQKKKPRIPEIQDETISIMTDEPILRNESRHNPLTLKHSQHSLLMPNSNEYQEPRYSLAVSRNTYRNSEMNFYHYPKPDDALASRFYRLSLNGFTEYVQRHEGKNIHSSSSHYNYQTMGYNNPYLQNSYPMHFSQHYSQPHSPMSSQHSPSMSHHSQNSPHLSQSSLHLGQMSQHTSMSQHSQLSQHSPLSQHNAQLPSHSPQLSHSPVSQHSVMMQRVSQSHQNYPVRISQDYTGKFAMPNKMPLHRQPSPTASTNSIPIPQPKGGYYPSHTLLGDPSYRYTIDNASTTSSTPTSRNPHQIQPHQQYENNGITTGLGGSWKRAENGEMFWCYANNSVDSNWQKDRRFGSLDRRRNKRLHKRVSPIDDKSATISTTPSHNDQVKTAFVKPSQVAGRKSQERQLTRTQSLGSVGQTLDHVYPSDDTSSCESDNRSLKENHERIIRKQKEKKWLETSLDGPISPTHSTHSTVSWSHSTVSSIPGVLAPEEKYIDHSPSNITPSSPIPPHIIQTPPEFGQIAHIPSPLSQMTHPLNSKPDLEIPAESNPSFRVLEQPNMELLNNNIPKNCTVIQAGGCKPYHEETKPFEMSDFYKYSTKFKKSPVKQEVRSANFSQHRGSVAPRNLNECYEDVENNSLPQNQQQHMRLHQQYNMHSQSSHSMPPNRDASGNMNKSLDLSQIKVAEHFSAEMNAWYNDQNQHIDNNNTNTNKSRSSATLV